MIFSEREIRDALKEEPEQAKVMIEANALEFQNKTLVAERRHNLRSLRIPAIVVLASGAVSLSVSLFDSLQQTKLGILAGGRFDT